MAKRVLTQAAMNRYAGHLVAQAPAPPCPTREEVYDSHEQLRKDHAAALNALAEARKLLEESRLMFHRGEYPGRHGDACHQLGLRVTTFLATSTPPTTDIPRAASAAGATE